MLDAFAVYGPCMSERNRLRSGRWNGGDRKMAARNADQLQGAGEIDHKVQMGFALGASYLQTKNLYKKGRKCAWVWPREGGNIYGVCLNFARGGGEFFF